MARRIVAEHPKQQHPDDRGEPEELSVEQEPDDTEAAVVPFDIATYPSDLTLSVVYEMWHNNDIVVPDFQRNFVWNIKQSSLLIESFLLGLPVPQVFFYIDEANKSLVIDGQQRIMSVVFFMDGYFGSESLHGKKQVFRLNLGDKNQLNRKRFEDLSDSQQRRLKASVLRAINIRQLQPIGEATSVYHIFERLNTGGTPLTPQEIRNCVFRGGMVSKLRKLNGSRAWRLVLGKITRDRHQKDLELLLRIFGLAYFFDDYEKPMKEFLSKIMASDRDAQSAEFADFEMRFGGVAEMIFEKLGEKPFHINGPLNSSVLDAVFSTLITGPTESPDDLGERFKRLKEDKEFRLNTYYSTSDKSVIKNRFQRATEVLLG